MKKYFFILFLILIFLCQNIGFTYCFSTKDNIDNDKAVKILAIVNNVPVTNFDVLNYMKHANEFETLISDGAINKYIFNDINNFEKCLEHIINKKIIYSKFDNIISKMKDDNSIDSQIDNIVEKLNLSGREELKKKFYINDNLKNFISEILLINGIIDLYKNDISFEKVRDYYKQSGDKFIRDTILNITIFKVDNKIISSTIKNNTNNDKVNSFFKRKIKKCKSSDDLKKLVFKYFNYKDKDEDCFIYGDIPVVEYNALKSGLGEFKIDNNVEFYGPFFNKQNEIIFFRINDILDPRELSLVEAHDKILNILKEKEKTEVYNRVIENIKLCVNNGYKIIYL